MDLSSLTAISPVDGRYRNKTENLSAYFSEFALIKYRVRVEIEYFIALVGYLPQLRELDTEDVKAWLRKVYQDFTEKDALRVKEIKKHSCKESDEWGIFCGSRGFQPPFVGHNPDTS